MTLLQVDHVSFGYETDALFDDVTFTLAAGERLALVAPNGQGKSTLLKIIAGALQPDEGQVIITRGARVAYLHQSHEPRAAATLWQVLLEPFAEALAARAALGAAEHEAAGGKPEDLARLAKAQDAFHLSGADAIERNALMIAEHVGFSANDLARRVSSLSGGERGRLSLAAVLAAKPDVLLLDEPTNHLDLETVAWLERYLSEFRGAAVIVSHDRAFIDAVCPKTAELGLLRFRFYDAPYSRYLGLREAEIARERAAFEQQREEIARTEDFIRRNIAGQNTKQARGRRTRLARLTRLENPEDIWADAKKMGLRFAPSARSGDVVLEAKGLGAARGGARLFSGIDLQLRRGDRLAIIGKNGAGKTTLLKMLARRALPEIFAGEPAPEDDGEIKLGTQLDVGYFDQQLESLGPSRTPVEEVQSAGAPMSIDDARQYLARFRFFGDDALRVTGSMSGGERTRLALAKLLRMPRNFLLLDEPTNHLDIPASEILEEALIHFTGTLIVVSHDRYFLRRITTRVLAIEEGRGVVHNAPYQPWMSERRVARAEAAPVSADPPDKKATYEAQKKQQREQERRARRVAELEKQVAAHEAALHELKAEHAGLDPSDWQRMAALSEQESALQTRIDALTEEWMALLGET